MSTEFYNEINEKGQIALREAVEIEVRKKHLKIPDEYVIRIKTEKDNKIKEVKTLCEVLQEIKTFMDLDFIESISISKTYRG